jgi:membrane associated rhomboid family serine protease
MQTERTFIDDIKYQFRYGGMTIRLLILNAAVFIGIQLILVIGRLIGGEFGGVANELLRTVFALHTDPVEFLLHPWGLFTSIFSHFGFFHFLFNMVFLYFSGRMFEQLFDQKRLLYTYLLGGFFGGFFELLAHSLFPALQGSATVVVGASGSIMAIFSAIAFYRPNMTVMLFGLFPVRIIIIAGIFILSDLVSLGTADNTAHFAHIGGVVLGMLSIRSIYSSRNIINRAQFVGDRISLFFQGIFQRKPKMKVTKGGGRTVKRDEDYAFEAKQRQEKIDKILDKISKSGYDSLSKAEKDFLFQQSKK